MNKERSPFSPGQPVPPEHFTGRQEQVKLLKRAIRQASAGNSQYVFITGERGIGKSSLANLAKEVAEKEFGFIGAKALLGGADSLGEVCRRLYQSLVTQLPDKNLIDRAKKVFARYVDGIDLFGLGIEFKKDDESRASLAGNFLPLLFQIQRDFAELGRPGIMLIADDLNGIARESNFAHFLKSTVDEIAVGPHREFPWIFMLVGVPERMDDLREQQPSVSRIFQPIELSVMGNDEATAFFHQALTSVGHRWEDAAIETMAVAAGGHPAIWHELGDAVFWEDQDGLIDSRDVSRALDIAAVNVGRKYLDRPLYEELRSESYSEILRYISSIEGNVIRRRDAKDALSEPAARSFDNFIRKMRHLGFITDLPAERGTYRFSNLLFQLYVMLRSRADREKRPQRRSGTIHG